MFGSALLAGAFGCWLTAAGIVGTAEETRWSDGLIRGLFVAGVLCFAASLLVLFIRIPRFLVRVNHHRLAAWADARLGRAKALGEEQRVQLKALEHEREGYVARRLWRRVGQVDKQIRLLKRTGGPWLGTGRAEGAVKRAVEPATQSPVSEPGSRRGQNKDPTHLPPPPRARHRVMRRAVELSVLTSGIFGERSVTCEVIDPVGGVARAQTRPRAPRGALGLALGGLGPRTATTLYPTEFEGADPLYPGAYHVEWHIPNPLNLLGPEVVHDAFRVPPEESRDD